MKKQEKRAILDEYFTALKEQTPQRDLKTAARGRAHFLAEVESLQKPQQASWIENLRERIASLQFQGNRRFATAIASILIALMITFGAVGGTVYASQDSLPDQTLYAVKTLTEDIQLRFTDQAQEKIDLLEKFSNRRMEEMTTLNKQGQEIPQNTLARFEQHIEAMLELSAELSEESQTQSLSKIRHALQVHEELIHKLANRESGTAEQALLRVQEKLQARIQLVEEGIADPALFRELMQGQRPFGPEETQEPGKPEDVGTPEEKGKPEDVGTPENKGKPEDVGTPEGAGKPEGVGPPGDKGKP
ncbi:MAG: DUF5667 domain-containing protein [Anaerolineales bacterium]